MARTLLRGHLASACSVGTASVLAAACAGPASIPGLVLNSCADGALECSGPARQEPQAVVFLVGDAGYAEFSRNPVLQHVQAAVSGLAGRGIPVTVVYLGDNVYGAGIRAGHPEDLWLLDAQVEVVRGSEAEAFFLPGNHDWANHHDSLAVLHRQEQALDSIRGLQSTDPDRAAVQMAPMAGCPGPHRIEVRNSVEEPLTTILALDSQWWIIQEEPRECPSKSKADAWRRLEKELEDAGRGPIIVAAHHPLISGGPHGGGGDMLKSLLYHARLSPQDLHSGPYRRYAARMRELMDAHAGAVLYAAGHDHSLQVHRIHGDTNAWHHVVSGSGSKTSRVGEVAKDGITTLFAAPLPGYMRLDIRRGGDVTLNVVAGCPAPNEQHGEDGEEPSLCAGAGSHRFRTVSTRPIR